MLITEHLVKRDQYQGRNKRLTAPSLSASVWFQEVWQLPERLPNMTPRWGVAGEQHTKSSDSEKGQINTKREKTWPCVRVDACVGATSVPVGPERLRQAVRHMGGSAAVLQGAAGTCHGACLWIYSMCAPRYASDNAARRWWNESFCSVCLIQIS